MRGGYDPERAALVLADAMAMGDKVAAKKWGVHRATVHNYRKRLDTDATLRQLFEEKKKSTERDLAELRVVFMREAIEQLRTKVHFANVRSIAGALKIVGELHQVAMAVEDERPDSPDPEAPAAEGGGDGAPFGAH